MIKIIVESNSDNLIKELNSFPRYAGISKVPFDDIKLYENLLKQFDVETVIAMDTTGGYECFYKFSDEYDGQWKHGCANPPHISKLDTFDVARNLCGSGWVLGNNDFYLDDMDKFNKIQDLVYNRSSSSNFSFIPSDKRNLGQKKGFYGI